MGIFGKLMFWKKDDLVPYPEKDPITSGPNLGLNKDYTGLNPNRSGFGDEVGNYPSSFPGMKPTMTEDDAFSDDSNFSKSFSPGFQPNQEPQITPASAFSKLGQMAQPSNDSSFTLSKNIEVISSRLDAIKAILDSLTQKVEKIEKIAEGEQKETNVRYNRW